MGEKSNSKAELILEIHGEEELIVWENWPVQCSRLPSNPHLVVTGLGYYCELIEMEGILWACTSWIEPKIMAQNWISTMKKLRIRVQVEGHLTEQRLWILAARIKGPMCPRQRMGGSTNFEKQINDVIVHCSILLKSGYAILKCMLFATKNME